MNVTTARAILTAYGLDATADPDVLTAAIEARGWMVQVERHDSWERQRRYRIQTQLSAGGPSAKTALVLALGKILAREEPPDPRSAVPVRSK